MTPETTESRGWLSIAPLPVLNERARVGGIAALGAGKAADVFATLAALNYTPAVELNPVASRVIGVVGAPAFSFLYIGFLTVLFVVAVTETAADYAETVDLRFRDCASSWRGSSAAGATPGPSPSR